MLKTLRQCVPIRRAPEGAQGVQRDHPRRYCRHLHKIVACVFIFWHLGSHASWWNLQCRLTHYALHSRPHELRGWAPGRGRAGNGVLLSTMLVSEGRARHELTDPQLFMRPHQGCCNKRWLRSDTRPVLAVERPERDVLPALDVSRAPVIHEDHAEHVVGGVINRDAFALPVAWADDACLSAAMHGDSQPGPFGCNYSHVLIKKA